MKSEKMSTLKLQAVRFCPVLQKRMTLKKRGITQMNTIEFLPHEQHQKALQGHLIPNKFPQNNEYQIC